MICEFNFQDKYGNIEETYIHVHHLKQIARIKKEYKVDPINDLRPVCPNCNAMLHRKKETLTIDELKKEINKASR